MEKTTAGRGCSEEIAKTLQREPSHGNLLCLKAPPEQFAVQEISYRALVAGDGLDVDELTGEGGDSIHARQDTLVRQCRAYSVSSVV